MSSLSTLFFSCYVFFPLLIILGDTSLSPSFKRRPSTISMITVDRKQLNLVERLGRAAAFYTKAIPVFASYKMLDLTLDIQRNYLGKNVTDIEEAEQWSKLHDWGSDTMFQTINVLKGFYVKTGQIISTRVDIFPEQYTSKLSAMQDSLDPVPVEDIKHIVQQELLCGAPLSDLFSEFDDVPLGSASIAQVHRARLLDGRVVAVKVQRPEIEGKLLGDITNLKNFALIVQDALPVDYYKVFCEMERTLLFELDFFHEAQATQKMASAVSHFPSNKPRPKPSVVIPLPISGLVSRRVMVMEYIDGIALSKVATEMKRRGVTPDSPESQLFCRRLLTALTDAYSSMIFGSGMIHGDPHPGNIFVLPSGDIALLDCGQVKFMTTDQRLSLAKIVVKVNQWEEAQFVDAEGAEAKLLVTEVADLVRANGVEFEEGVGDECAAAVAVLLFGNSATKLPGGYSGEEISPSSPIVKVTNFPQEFVLLGRATVMIRGIANRLGVAWGLSDRWSAVAQEALDALEPAERLPIWSVSVPTVPTTSLSGGAALSRDAVVSMNDVVDSFRVSLRLVASLVTRSLLVFFARILPPAIKKTIIRFMAQIILKTKK